MLHDVETKKISLFGIASWAILNVSAGSSNMDRDQSINPVNLISGTGAYHHMNFMTFYSGDNIPLR